jgi:hypothetical protein
MVKSAVGVWGERKRGRKGREGGREGGTEWLSRGWKVRGTGVRGKGDSKRPSASRMGPWGVGWRTGGNAQLCRQAARLHAPPTPIHTHTHPTPSYTSHTPCTPPSLPPCSPSPLSDDCAERVLLLSPVVDWRRLKGRAGLSCCSACSCPWTRTARTRATRTRRRDDGRTREAYMVSGLACVVWEGGGGGDNE